jgi:putative aldouronate transport system substrate-binding protein
MKGKGIKKLTALMLVLLMAASLLSGCGGKNSTTGTGGADKGTEVTPGSNEETDDTENTSGINKNSPDVTAASNGIKLPELSDNTLKLEISIAEYQSTSEGKEVQKLWQEKMEKYLGCKLEINWTRTPAVDYSANELVVLQSGRVPDVATVTKGGAVNEYGEDETLLNLADYTKYMRYYTDYMADTNGGENYAKNMDGSMYYFMDGFYNPDNIMGAQSFTAFAYRFDLLKNNNWNPPTTLDEFTKLCADIQSKIDDGSLDLDYVMINNTKDYSLYRGFVGLFHTWDTVYYNGTEWVFGPLEDNFREMLKYVNSLYKAGYIDPEFATADFNQGQTKATTNVGAICPTLWAGSVAGWNTAKVDETMEWGLAYLPENEKYGTPWKWGSRQEGKSLNSNMGIYISAETEHPEYVVAMIDYQYSDQMIELMNWGVEGTTYTKNGEEKAFTDTIMKSENPATVAGDYGITASSVCRTGIVFNPIDFNAMLSVASIPEPWWSKDKGYYEGKYWVESSVNGGEDSVAPYDRPPVTYLSAEEQSAKAQLNYSGTCETRVKELAYQFIVGEKDINDDAQWQSYIKDIKSQTDDDFDDILSMLNERTVK